MKVLIVEDESAAYANIRKLLLDSGYDIEIVAHFETVCESVSWLKENPSPDLIFLDVQLADGISFQIFECINIDAPIIFTTAYDQYAIDAFKVNSIDYLLKPITAGAIHRALEKYTRVNRSMEKVPEPDMEQLFCSKDYAKRILVSFRDKILPIKIERIAYFYATNGITTLYTMDGLSYKLDKPLDSIIRRLDPNLFYRANRQFILSKDVVENITVWFDSRLRIDLVIQPNEQIYISKNKASEFKKWLEE